VIKKVSGFISIALFSISIAACSGGGSDCDAVGKHVLDLMEKQMKSEGGSEEEMKLAKAMLPAIKDEMVKKCKSEKWPEATRKCIVGADTPEAMAKCEPPEAPKDDKAEEKKSE
jgi:hypothetical protein